MRQAVTRETTEGKPKSQPTKFAAFSLSLYPFMYTSTHIEYNLPFSVVQANRSVLISLFIHFENHFYCGDSLLLYIVMV
jgi:hypothetical protein